MKGKKTSHHVSALSLSQARGLVLKAQGLTQEHPFGSAKKGTLSAIEHLGYVQIDTISVVERAHHHTLWSRVPDYHPRYLHELQAKDRKVFEYWSHAAAYLPVKDFRFALPRMEEYAKGKRHWFRRDRQVCQYVLDRIRAEGPLQARDFEAPEGHRGGTWFEWKPAKRALEQLFWSGELMVRERRGFQKVFDLRERVLPSGVNTSMPSADEYLEHLIRTTLRAQGLATAREIAYQRSVSAERLGRVIRQLLESGELTEVEVQGIVKQPYYALTAVLVELGSVRRTVESRVRILSPFDNLVIQRKRLSKLFGYDYQIECYVPEPKRKFGYFCLPMLREGRFLGRIDAKADRKEGVLRVARFHWEAADESPKKYGDQIIAAIDDFARFNSCGRVDYSARPCQQKS